MALTGSISSASDFLSFSDLIEHEENASRGEAVGADRKCVELNVDFQKFSNHCWFNSAYIKAYNAIYRIQNILEDDATYNQIAEFYYSGTHFDRHIYDTYPKRVGYYFGSGETSISGSDPEKFLVPGTGSWSYECWYNVGGTGSTATLLGMSGDTEHLICYFNSGTNQTIFGIHSASTVRTAVVAPKVPRNTNQYLAVVYDRDDSWIYAYTGSATQRPVLTVSQSFALGDVYCYKSGSSIFSIGSSSYTVASLGRFSGSIDEVRIWRKKLSGSFIYDNYNTNVYPDHNNLVLYYKINEGGTTTSSIDCKVRDYSGNDLDGYIIGYSSANKVSGTLLQREEGTMLSAYHPSVVAFTSSWFNSGTIYDTYNNQLITKQFPEFVLDDDVTGDTTKYLYALAEIMDEIQLYTDHMLYLDYVNYQGKQSCPDELLPLFSDNRGFMMKTMFDNATMLQQEFGDGILYSGSSFVPVDHVRKMMWRRIANNIPYFLKSKGTTKSLNGLLRSIGLDERHIKIKNYSFLKGETIDDQLIYSHISVPFLNLSGDSRVKIQDINTVNKNDMSIEVAHIPFITSSFTTGSVMHMYSGTVDPLTKYISVELRRNEYNSGVFHADIYDGVADYVELTSSILPVFYKDRFHVALTRCSSSVTGGTIYKLYWGLYDINNIRTYGSSSIVVSSGCFNAGNPTVFVGSDSGNVSDAYGWFSEFRYYPCALNQTEFLSHVYDLRNYGTYDILNRSASIRLPLDDRASIVKQGEYFADVLDVVGRTMYSATIPTNVPLIPFVNKRVYYKYKSQDVTWSEDIIRVRNQTDLTPLEQAIDFGIVSVEANPIDALNEDISREISSNKIYNNLYGNVISKLRNDYTLLRIYRNKYFAKFADRIHINRYMDANKWLNNIDEMIEQLVPAKKKFFGGQFVIEPHALEIDKETLKYSLFKTPSKIDIADCTPVTYEAESHRNQSLNDLRMSSFDGYVRRRHVDRCGAFANAEERLLAKDEAYSEYYKRDNINLRNNKYMISGSDVVGDLFKVDNDEDFDMKKMNLRNYYDITVFASGSYLNVPKNLDVTNIFCRLPEVMWNMHTNNLGNKWSQARFLMEISCSTKSIQGCLRSVNVFFNRNGDTSSARELGTGLVYRYKDNNSTIVIEGTIVADATDIELDSNMCVPQVDLSSSLGVYLTFYSGTTYGKFDHEDTITVKQLSWDFDVHSTGTLSNDDVKRNFMTTGTISTPTANNILTGTYSYYLVRSKNNKYKPFERHNVVAAGGPQLGAGKSAQDFMGGVHYANIMGQTYNQTHGGSKEYGTRGITEADMIRTQYSGSKIVIAWPNQMHLQNSNKFLILNDAYGDRTDQVGEGDGWIYGNEIFLDEKQQYDLVDVWIYTNIYNISDDTDVVTLDVRPMTSPFWHGPLSYAPTLSGNVSGPYSYLMQTQANTYRTQYPTTMDTGWVGIKLQYPIDSIKRFRIDAKGSKDNDSDHHLKNAIVFAQFMHKNVSRLAKVQGEAEALDHTAVT